MLRVSFIAVCLSGQQQQTPITMSTLTARLAEVQQTLENLNVEMNNLPLFTAQAPGLEAEIRKMHEACRLAIQQAKLAKSIGND